MKKIKAYLGKNLMKLYKYFHLNDLEFWIFKKLLHRYSTYELDQHSRWKFETKYRTVFVSIDRQGDGYKYDDLSI